MVYVFSLNMSIGSCPNNFTKLRPVIFKLLIYTFIYKIKIKNTKSLCSMAIGEEVSKHELQSQCTGRPQT